MFFQNLLSCLTELLLPWFFTYLTEIEDGLTFVFAHRWLLVCMKREFKLEDTIMIWEACWTNYSTNSFLFFVCVAVMAMYGQRALDQDMTLNELTVHFSSLSNSLPTDIVLSQARGYLYHFMKCSEVPCALRSLMTDDFWSQQQAPKLICRQNGSCCSGDRGGGMVTWWHLKSYILLLLWSVSSPICRIHFMNLILLLYHWSFFYYSKNHIITTVIIISVRTVQTASHGYCWIACCS